MKNLFKIILLIPFFHFAWGETPAVEPATEQDANALASIEQSIITLEENIDRKKTMLKLYNSRKPELLQLRTYFREQLNKKEILYFTADYQNIFNLANIYKDVTSLLPQYESKLSTIFSVEKFLTSAKEDHARIQQLKKTLIGKKDNGLPPELVEKQNQAIKYCETFENISAKLINDVEADQKRFDTLARDITRLKDDGKTLKVIIQRTINERSLGFISNLRAASFFNNMGQPGYRPSENTDVKGKEFVFLWKSLPISLVLSVGLSWLLFAVGLRKILAHRTITLKTPFAILIGTLIIFALAMASLGAFKQLDYYKKITALGPEFLLTVMTIILALSVRLKQEKFFLGLLMYLPMFITCTVLICLRLMEVPNLVVRLSLPVLCLLMSVCCFFFLRKTKDKIPHFDRAMGVISFIFLAIGTILSWSGFAFLAFLGILFWNILMSSLLLLVGLSTLQKNFQEKHAEKNGKSESWFASFFHRLLLPVLSLFLLLFSLYWPLEVFDLGDTFFRSMRGDYAAAEANADGTGAVSSKNTAPGNSKGAVKDALQKTSPSSDQSSENSLVKNLTPINIVVVILLGIVLNYLMYLGKKSLRDLYGDNYERGGIPTLITISSLIIWSSFIIISLMIVQANFNGIFVVLGGMSLGLGFAMKDTIENIICGISLMFGRLKQGDYVECDGIRGKVLSLGYRSTFIETVDGAIIAFQNIQLFNKNFRNLTQNHVYELNTIKIGVAYSTDFDRVKEITLEAIRNADASSKTRTPSVFLDSFGDNSVNVAILIWVPVKTRGTALSKIREEVYKLYNENGIEIPFPQQDVYIKAMPEGGKEKTDDDGSQTLSIP